MNIEGMDFGRGVTPWGYAHMMRRMPAGVKPSSKAISLNDDSVSVEWAVRGSGTNVPFPISQKSNADISKVFQGEKKEVVDEAVKIDAAASRLLDEKMSEKGQPKV